MILALMGFLLAVSILAAAGAMLVETGLRHLGTPTRFAWLGALALGPALLAVQLARPGIGAAQPGLPAWAPVIDLPGIGSAGVTTWGFGLEGAAALVWLVTGVWVVALVARTHRALTLECAGWEGAQVVGRDVFVSTDRGPAVVGVWDPWIVLPRWALALPERELRLIVLHEEEHLRAKDTHLLGVALALVALTAWNPVAWWHLRRLRAAMEIDCDRRVLGREPDRAVYGASLLSVAARAAGPSLGLAAFTEGSINLKRRILAMTMKASGWTAMGGGVLVVLGVVVGVQACGIESPVGPQPAVGPAPVEVSAPSPEPPPPPPSSQALREGPVFTPYTQAPAIINREEVGQALQKAYPAELRAAKVAGTVLVFLFIDERGAVANALVDRSSGQPALDEGALQVARVMKFEPARNGETVVPVWVKLPITFTVR